MTSPRPRAGPARRQHHHGPHLAGRQHRAQRARRRLLHGTPDPAAGLQLLWLAPRQPRGHDARHLRQHPPAQRGRPRHRGRLDKADAGWRSHVDLRRRDGLPGARGAAGGDRRQGVRLGLIARLGGQGHAAARRQGGDRRELRAHPPLQPGRHGRAAADFQGRHDPQDAATRRQRAVRHLRPRRRHQTAPGRLGHDHPRRRPHRKNQPALPDRHAG